MDNLAVGPSHRPVRSDADAPSARVAASRRDDAAGAAPATIVAAFAAERDPTGFVVVPVRDAQLVVRGLPLQPDPSGLEGAGAQSPAVGAMPMVLAWAVLLLWIAVRRSR